MTQQAPRPITLAHAVARQHAIESVRAAPDGWVVRIGPPSRTNDQNAKFHAAVSDIAKAMPEWNGMSMDAEDWKALLVVSHAIATRGDTKVRLVPDLEGNGLVQLRESTARMSKERGSSLIEYTIAWAASHSIELSDEAR